MGSGPEIQDAMNNIVIAAALAVASALAAITAILLVRQRQRKARRRRTHPDGVQIPIPPSFRDGSENAAKNMIDDLR